MARCFKMPIWPKKASTSSSLSTTGSFSGTFMRPNCCLDHGISSVYGIEELYRGEETVDRIRGQLALIDEVELVVPDVVQPQLRRAYIAVGCITGDVLD